MLLETIVYIILLLLLSYYCSLNPFPFLIGTLYSGPNTSINPKDTHIKKIMLMLIRYDHASNFRKSENQINKNK